MSFKKLAFCFAAMCVSVLSFNVSNADAAIDTNVTNEKADNADNAAEEDKKATEVPVNTKSADETVCTDTASADKDVKSLSTNSVSSINAIIAPVTQNQISLQEVVTPEAVTVAADAASVITQPVTQAATQTGTAVTAAKDKKNSKKKPSYTKAELRLMSSIIFCEANIEPYSGKLAVGIVVMNRVASKDFADSIKDVIYEKGQFSPVRNGALKRALARYDAGKFTSKNEKQCIKAAKRALEGEKSVVLSGGKQVNMKKYHFFSVYLRNARLRIKGHRFK